MPPSHLAWQTMGAFAKNEWYAPSARLFMLLVIMVIRISVQADCTNPVVGWIGTGDKGGSSTPTSTTNVPTSTTNAPPTPTVMAQPECNTLLCSIKLVSSYMTY